MPIRALQKREAELKMPIVGRLWKGGPKQKKNGKEIFGIDLKDHFRFTSPIPGAEAAFESLFGDKPIDIPFCFPFASVDANFSTWQEAYTGQRLIHRCDGEFVTRYYDSKAKRYVSPEPGKMECPGGCDYVGRFSLLIPEFVRRGYAGAVNLTLGGHNEVPMLYDELNYYYQQRGNLTGMEFVLYRYPKRISRPEGGRVEKWLVGFKPHAQFIMAMIDQQPDGVLALESGDEQLALPEAIFDDVEAGQFTDAAVVEDEAEEEDDTPVQSVALRERFEQLVTTVYNGEGEKKRTEFRAHFDVASDDDYDDQQLDDLIAGLEKKLDAINSVKNKAKKKPSTKPRWFTQYTNTLMDAYPDDDERNKAQATHAKRCSVPDMTDATDEQLELLVKEMRGFIEAQREQAKMPV